MKTIICKSWEKQVLENTQKLDELDPSKIDEVAQDVSELNQQMARTLKTPLIAPTKTQLVGVSQSNDQAMVNLGEGLKLVGNTLSAEGGIKFQQIYSGTEVPRYGCPIIVFAESYSGEAGAWITAIPNTIPGSVYVLNEVPFVGGSSTFTLTISEDDFNEETGSYNIEFFIQGDADSCYIAYLPI